MSRTRPALFLLLALLVLLNGCGVLDYFFLPPPEDTAQELYDAGMDAMHDKDYDTAVEYFTKIKDRYPFSPFTPQAEIGLADAHFLNEDYDLAVEAYKEFEALHPRHEEMPYVLYQIAVCYLNQFDSVDMPQTQVVSALEYFYRVEESYPDTKYGKSSKEKIVECRRILAEHEIFIADFFWRVGRYGSAWQRYEYVVKNFGDLPRIRNYAQKRAEYAYFEYQKSVSEDEREKLQGSWKEWFEWL